MDRYLAQLLRGDAPNAPPLESLGATVLGDRALYHGLAGLLIDRPIALWPEASQAAIRSEARAMAMWEMRHKQTISMLVEALADAGIASIVLKGTALAYAHYARPAQRARGDTDLLVRDGDVEGARAILRSLGYARTSADAKNFEDLQEMWFVSNADGTRHEVDLHWQVVDSLALRSLLEVPSCFASARPLAALSPRALRLDDPEALIHASVHRIKHLSSPYYSAGRVYYSADRLIWSYDIDLLARRITKEGRWERLVECARRNGVATIIAAALESTLEQLGTPAPRPVIAQLGKEGELPENTRLLHQINPLRRGLSNALAIPGIWQRAAYILRRAFPGELYVRLKYPDMEQASLARLYWRRIREAARRTLS